MLDGFAFLLQALHPRRGKILLDGLAGLHGTSYNVEGLSLFFLHGIRGREVGKLQMHEWN